MKKTIFNLLRVCISLSLLALLFFFMRDKLDDFAAVIRDADINIFLLSLSFIVPVALLSAFRFKLFLSVQGVDLKYPEVLRLVLIGYFFNNFMPSTVGGDVAKLYYAKKAAGDYTRPLSAIFADRVTGLAALLFLACAAVLSRGQLIANSAVKSIIIFCSGFFILFICIILSGFARGKLFFILDFPLLKKIKLWLLEISQAVSLYGRSKIIVYGFMLSLISHLITCVYAFTLSKCIYLDVPFAIFLILTPVIGLMSCLPSLNGLGIRESATVYFYKDFMMPEQALALSILFLSHLIPISMAGAMVYLFSGERKIKEAVDD